MLFLIYPHQLFESITPLLGKRVLLIEEPLFFTQYAFHLQKLITQRASMKFYESYLLSKGVEVEYYEDESYLDRYSACEVMIYDVVDDYLFKKIQKHFKKLHILPNPNFLNTADTTTFLHRYYINRRIEHGILVDFRGKPEGGKWSFDSQNRKKIPKGLKTPLTPLFENRFIDEAKCYAKKFDTIGACEDFYYPTTFSEAKTQLQHFLAAKFEHFGTYQDAIVASDSFLFHANISSALNMGLLDLRYVIEQVLDSPAPLNAKEGFIRQIIGWREFMKSTYEQSHVKMRNSNFFHAHNHMPKKVLEGNTGLEPLDNTIRKIHQSGYAHHIERLMILGNLFVLLEIEPNESFEFFMSHFVDAYDWVMVGNLYGMSGFCDGGSITTKPYIASSNYILKMSDYKRGPWCEIVDALYWSFMEKHAHKFASNPRMAMQIALLEKMDKDRLAHHRKTACEFKRSLGIYEFSESDNSRLIEMAWQDRTPFDAIEKLYGLSENEVKKEMRSLLKPSSFKMWRERVQGRKTKHIKQCEHKPSRFQGPW